MQCCLLPVYRFLSAWLAAGETARRSRSHRTRIRPRTETTAQVTTGEFCGSPRWYPDSDTPWDLAWGPDDRIWVTERRGIISRVDTSSGQITQVREIPAHEVSESGLMGVAFHPDFENLPIVFAVHSYNTSGGIRNRLVRMTWDGAALGAPETLLDEIPGASNHDGSRLAVGSDGYLYMSTGDAAFPNLAQDLNSLAGKILRLDLNGNPAPDNPFGSAVYSFGHRNPQGLVFHPETGELFSTEHGPRDNEEVNRIEAGRNYGWPNVKGYCDGDIPGLDEAGFCSAKNVTEPFAVWTPTIAPAGADIYVSERIPGWKGSLLFTT